MAEPITIQKLIDASLDSDSLEVLVNGDENTDVNTRLGETYPSVKKAIKTLFESGGLPATPFTTKAAMESSAAILGDYAVVTDDLIDANNGLYFNDGSWVRSKYNITDLVRNLAEHYESLENSKVFYNSNRNIIEVVDATGATVLRIDENGSIHTTDLTNSIQKSIKDAEGIKTESGNLLEFVDSEFNTFAYFDATGGLRLTGIDGTAQGSIRKYAPKAFTPANRDSRYELSPASYTYLSGMAAKNPIYCPPVINTMPQNYTINSEWINNLTLTQPSEYSVVDSPYDGVKTVVHPSIAEFWGGLNGYRYYVALNPYGNGGEPVENPCLYGSNNLQDFDLLDFVPQPLDKPAVIVQYLSDNHISYDPNTGEMLIVWRDSGLDGDGLWISRTSDGINFTDKTPLWPVSNRSTHGGLLSPSLLFNIAENLWYMYTTRTDGSFEYRTANKLTGKAGDWSASNIIFSGDVTWHCDVRLIGDKVVVLINHRASERLQLAISTDWKSFTLSTNNNMLTGDAPYKASFVPIFNDNNQMALQVVWTSYNTGDVESSWRLYSATTNYVNYL